MKSTPKQEYRIAPELRRCSWYAIISAVPLAIIFCWVARSVRNLSITETAIGCLGIMFLSGLMVIPLRWRLRIDQHGLARRLLYRWDTWDWGRLASGKIGKLHPITLYDPERPWWCRKLNLSYMASDDQQEVISAINAHYRLPPPPAIPPVLKIKYGFRSVATFDPIGLHLLIGNRPYEYTWTELSRVHITRMDPVRRDFCSLVISLPEQEIHLQLVTHQGGTSPNWGGATAEEINEYLLLVVPKDLIQITIAGEPLKSREHIEKRLRHVEKTRRELTIVTAVFVPLITIGLVWMALDSGIIKAAVMAFMFFVFLVPIYLFVFRVQNKQITELRRMLTSGEFRQ